MGSTKPSGPRPHTSAVLSAAMTVVSDIVNTYGEDEHFSAIETISDFFANTEGVTKGQAQDAFNVIDGLIDSNTSAMATEKNIYNIAMDVIWVDIAQM